MTRKLSATALLFAGLACGQAYTFSGVSALDLEHGSARMTFTVSADAYVQILFDTVSGGHSGTYDYSTISYLTVGKTGFISIGALKPATPYFFVITARPNPNDATGLVTSTEFTFTTLADPGHPVLPIPPNQWNPPLPDTSAYTVVPMAFALPECIANANVTAPAGNTSWTGNVTAGMTVQQVLNVVGYGTILDFAQGAVCNVPDTNIHHSGYYLMPKTVDPLASGISDPNHRWIIIQTHQNSPLDFPPAGFRTSAQWDAKVATFVAQVPTDVVNTSGQHFQTWTDTPGVSPGNVHHYMFSHVRLTVNTSQTGDYGPYISFGGNCTSSFVQVTPPSYNVIEQVREVGAPVSTTARSSQGMNGCPQYLAVRNSSIEAFDAPGTGNWAQSIYFSDWSRGSYTIDNNLLQGVGENVYFEANGQPGVYTSADDVVLSHNYFNWPLYTLEGLGSTTWDGQDRLIRNQFETKGAHRLLFKGNIIDGQWSYQNEGSAIFVSGNDTYFTGQTGNTDISVTDNVVRNAAGFFNCMGTRGDNVFPPDPGVGRRVQLANNLGYSLGRYLWNYTGHGASLYSGYLITSPGCQDLVVNQNTMGFTNADSGTTLLQYIPMLLAVGSGAQLSEGFYFQKNIAYFSVGNPTSNAGVQVDSSQAIAAFPRLPLIPAPISAGQAAAFNVAMTHLDGTSTSGTPNGVWGGNVLIGGTLGSTGAEPWPDLGTNTGLYNTQMPAGDVYASGSTMAARATAAGLTALGGSGIPAYTCTPTAQNPAVGGNCGAGADVAVITSSAGIVSTLAVNPGASSASVTYSAPDTRACSLDYGTGGTYATRLTDSGGSTARTLSISGLTPSTTYNYRLMCYFDQGTGATVPDGANTLGTFRTTGTPTLLIVGEAVRSLPGKGLVVEIGEGGRN